MPQVVKLKLTTIHQSSYTGQQKKILNLTITQIQKLTKRTKSQQLHSDTDDTDEYVQEIEDTNNTTNNLLKQYKPTKEENDRLQYCDGWSDEEAYNDLTYHMSKPPFQRNITDRLNNIVTDTEMINKIAPKDKTNPETHKQIQKN